MPQSHNFIASKTNNGEVHVFDYFLHGVRPESSEVKPDIVLEGHCKEGYALDWNPNRQGYLASGSDDNLICIWDINQSNSVSKTHLPLKKTYGHSGAIEDLSWNYFSPNEYVTVGDDKRIKLWDIRQEKAVCCVEGHVAEIMAVDTSPFDQNLLLTGSADGSIAVWDIRSMDKNNKIMSFRHRKDEVSHVKFSRAQPSIFASVSGDRKVMLWDFARCGERQTEEQKKDGPPELVFVHAGHTSKVSDISINQNEHLMIASCAEDNIFQVWEVAADQIHREIDQG